jgi:hypothetical protein
MHAPHVRMPLLVLALSITLPANLKWRAWWQGDSERRAPGAPRSGSGFWTWRHGPPGPRRGRCHWQWPQADARVGRQPGRPHPARLQCKVICSLGQCQWPGRAPGPGDSSPSQHQWPSGTCQGPCLHQADSGGRLVPAAGPSGWSDGTVTGQKRHTPEPGPGT